MKSKKGFTLVELIVVLVILAVLAAIGIPALTGYIDKAKTSKIKQDSRTAVVALQSWAVEKYAEGLKGDDLQDDIILTPGSPEIKDATESTTIASKYTMGIDFYNNATQGTRMSIFNAGAGTSGVTAVVFLNEEFNQAAALSSAANTGKTFTLAPAGTEFPLGSYKISVAIVPNAQASAIQNMTYAEAKATGVLQEKTLNNTNNSSYPSGQSGSSGPTSGFLRNIPAMNYVPGSGSPAVSATYIWKEIVDSYAKNGIADDDNVVLDEVYFDEQNKVTYIDYKIGEQTCIYDLGKYTVN
jgi:prepilin-type N-terminal cleavage/methylation domain-containing protein